MTLGSDDAIVVMRDQKGAAMVRPIMGHVLHEALGDKSSTALVDFIEAYGEIWQDAVKKSNDERLEARLQALATHKDLLSLKAALSAMIASTKEDLTRSIGDLRTDLTREIANTRVEVLRWSFLFWLGQLAATAGMLSVLK